MTPYRPARALLCALVALVLAALVAGCGGNPVTQPESHVAENTPALRQLKQQAGIQPCRRATAPVARNGGLPDVTLPCLGGGHAVAMARLRGPMVVNLWAQWCAPCREELPHYEAFARKYAGRVPVLGVDWQDTQPRRALQLAKQTGVTYPQVADVERRIRAVGNALPNLVLVDRRGDVVFQQAVQIHSLTQLERLVRRHLHVAKPEAAA
ncbi:MAG: TlpA family protein disulfide reductase [Marmoricola sp.]